MSTQFQSDMARVEAVLSDYRQKVQAHERMVGQLKRLLEAGELDDALNIVRDEFNAIHGPND